MEPYAGTYSLPRRLVGDFDAEQVVALEVSGWKLNKRKKTWVKQFHAPEGVAETPDFLVQVIHDLQARKVMVEGPYPGSAPGGQAAAPPVPSQASQPRLLRPVRPPLQRQPRLLQPVRPQPRPEPWRLLRHGLPATPRRQPR